MANAHIFRLVSEGTMFQHLPEVSKYVKVIQSNGNDNQSLPSPQLEDDSSTDSTDNVYHSNEEDNISNNNNNNKLNKINNLNLNSESINQSIE